MDFPLNFLCTVTPLLLSLSHIFPVFSQLYLYKKVDKTVKARCTSTSVFQSHSLNISTSSLETNMSIIYHNSIYKLQDFTLLLKKAKVSWQHLRSIQLSWWRPWGATISQFKGDTLGFHTSNSYLDYSEWLQCTGVQESKHRFVNKILIFKMQVIQDALHWTDNFCSTKKKKKITKINLLLNLCKKH